MFKQFTFQTHEIAVKYSVCIAGTAFNKVVLPFAPTAIWEMNEGTNF